MRSDFAVLPFSHDALDCPAALDLAPGGADVWVIPAPSVSDRAWSGAHSCSAEEIARAARILPARASACFLRVRAAVRDILSRYAPGWRARDLRFAYGPCGKPVLIDSEIAFNVSRTREAALCCVAHGEVGIDLERVRRIPDMCCIARDFFTDAEADAIRSHPPGARTEAFFRLWTRKEACAKALGAGFAVPFWSFDVNTHDDEGTVHELHVAGHRLSLRSLEGGVPWVAALASQRIGVDRIRFWRYAACEPD
jgi:4'-phosphopantetheinyl transferase